MPPFFFATIAILVAYLCGSIPVGFIVARLYGVNVLASGSGRIGGTNVLRAAGPTAAGLTVLGDILKGLIPTYLLVSTTDAHLVIALAAAAAVIGHNYSIFLGFRGGVGAGTAIGALSGISLPTALIVAVIALIALSLSRYASVMSASIAASTLVLLTISALLGYSPYEYIVFGLLIVLVMFYALRSNFDRLRAGTERKIGRKVENISRISSE